MPTVMDEMVKPHKEQEYKDPDKYTIYLDDGPHEVEIHHSHLTMERCKALVEAERNGTKKGMPEDYQRKVQKLANLLKEKYRDEFQLD